MSNSILTIFNMSVTASVVILFVLLARLLLKRSPKIFSYALWAVVLFRLLCPVSITTDFSLLGLFNAPVAETTGHTTAFEYVPQDMIYVPNTGVHAPAINNAANNHDSMQEIIPNQNAVTITAPAPTINTLAVVAIVWLIGIGAMAVYSAVSFLRVKRKLIGSVCLRDNIYLVDYIDSPFVMGIIRPKIYLPSSLPQQERGYIILHEQHHIRRHDHVIKGLAFLALCIHWFNPLVWLAFVLSSKDMEMSCDEAVVKKLGESIRHDYSVSLLSLATGRHIIAGTPLAFGEGDTKSRIKNMLSWKKPKVWITVVAAVICVTVVVACAGNPAVTPAQLNAPATGDNEISNEQADHLAESENPVASVELWGDWNLDVAYTETANGGISLRDLFGTALGNYGASLRLSADGKIEYYIGLLTGKGTWHADGDTGRYIAEFIVYPDEREETLTFHEFQENPEHNRYIVLDFGDYALYWTQSNTNGSSSQYLNDIAYHLELSAIGKEYRNMDSSRKDMVIGEYGDLMNGYSMLARESTDGTSAYIVGVYNGEAEDSSLNMMYSVSLDGSGDEQLLYREAEQEAVERVLYEQTKPDVGYLIEKSYISYFNQGSVFLIQPKDISVYLDTTINRYLHTPNGPEYIRDAVSRGIMLNNAAGPYLCVYRVSEKYGEIFEKIPLTEEQVSAILSEESITLTEGFGFTADLYAGDYSELFTEKNPIPPTVLDLAVEHCDYRFGDPSYITDPILEARLDCDWLEEPLYADESDLERLKEILVNAEFGYVGACGYGAKLTLGLTGGEKLTVFKGTDGCDTMVFGSYGGYFIGDQENTEFWEMFGLDAETKALLSGEA